MSLARSATSLGANRRLAFRVGKPSAITAIARKRAVLVYRVSREEISYRDPGLTAYLTLYRERAIRNLRRRAAEHGLTLIDLQSAEILQPPPALS